MTEIWGRRIGAGVVALACVLLLVHCGGGNTSTSRGLNGSSLLSNAVMISPTVVNIASGQTSQFSALVGGAPSNAVTWSVSPAPGTNLGSNNINQIATVSSSGLLQAATNAPPVVLMVTATSTANSTLLASATVTIIPPGTVTTTNNPLVAKYMISIPRQATASIQFGPDTSYGLKTWSQPTPSDGSPLSFFVAGMKPNSTYHMVAAVQFSDGSTFNDQDHTFTTGALPAPAVNFTVSNPAGMTPAQGIELFDGVTVTPGSNLVQVGATDLQGNLIWYFQPPAQFPNDGVNPIKLLSNGNFIVVLGEVPKPGQIPPPSTGSMLEEVDLAGDIIWQLPVAQLNTELAAAGYNFTAYEIHHDVLPLSNGHIIAMVNTTRTFNDLPGYPGPTVVLGDVLVDLNQNLQPVWVWNEFDHLDVNRHPMQFPDWTHSNAIIYSPSDGDIIISIRHQNWILKIKYQNGAGNGDIVWRLGEGGDFTLQGGTDPIDWFYAQHGIKLTTPNSVGIFQIGMFDNGNDRIVDQNGDICGSPGVQACYSTVPIFRVNEVAKTATIVWRDTLPIYSFFGGNMQLLPNGNVEFDASVWGSNQSQVMEVTKESQPETVWQMNEYPSYLYRSFRIPSLYPNVTW